MVSQGARVIMACRSRDRADAARARIVAELIAPRPSPSATSAEPSKPAPSREDLEGRLVVRVLDTSSLQSVRSFVHSADEEKLLERLDLLILNAGVGGTVLDITNLC